MLPITTLGLCPHALHIHREIPTATKRNTSMPLPHCFRTQAGMPTSLLILVCHWWSLHTEPQGNSPLSPRPHANNCGPGRNGVQPTQQSAWGDWCNVKGTGFGVRPTTDTGDALTDAFVWVKPGGESDGTSDSSATRYDAHCGYSDALQPAPEAGTWFQVRVLYFV
jgi:hypothetical protein